MPRNIIYDDRKYLSLQRITPPLPQETRTRAFISEATAIVYNISGRKTVMVEGTTYPVDAGELILLKPGEAFRILEDEENASDYTILFFNRSFFRPYDPELTILRKFDDRPLGRHNVICLDAQQNTLIQSCLAHMEKEMSMNARYIAFVGMLMLLVNEIDLSSQVKTGLDDPEARDILLYINDTLSGDLGTKTLAQRFFMSESKFCRYFKSVTDMSPKSYITRKRVVKARQLLNRNVKIDDVMAQCGFSDYTTFYKAHAKYYNYPPSENYARGDYDPLFLKGIPQLDMERIDRANRG